MITGADHESVGHQNIERAPIFILDKAGFLDDDEDEYAPPIGETDAYGQVRYETESFAPKYLQTSTKDWTDKEVDAYFAKLAA